VLAAYSSCLDKKALSEDVLLVMDFANKGYSNLIKAHTATICSESHSLDMSRSSDLLTLQ
jgi:hypothetical protein